MSIVPLVLPMLTWCCAWPLWLAVCGHCRAPRWRMAVQTLASCTLPVSFVSRTHRHAPVGPCSRVRPPAHGRPQRGEECCRCAWWCARRLPRWLRGSTTTATTLMAWSCRVTMLTGGRWSRTDRSAKLGMSGCHRLGAPATAEEVLRTEHE
ncbi:surface protease GP63 [Trypanosoma cruzi]|nr:surface protease GP63 [Trypanosoma cruzi]